MSPVMNPIYQALMKAFDTKNRIIETTEEAKPTTSEMLNATQRVDDATVAIRSQLEELLSALEQPSSYYNQSSFESGSGLVWTAAPAANVG